MADQANDREVMDGVPDAVGQLAADIGVEAGRLRGAIPHAVDDLAIASKSFVRVFFQGAKNVTGRDTCVGHVALQALVSLPGVVIDLSCAQTFDQALEVLQHVPVVLSNRRVKWGPRNVRVRPVTQLKQQAQPLQQNVLRGHDQLRRLHLSLHARGEILKYFDRAKRVHASLLPITGISLRWRSRLIVEQTKTISASAKSRPLSP